MNVDAASAAEWKSFKDVMALVRAKLPRRYTQRDIYVWLCNCAVGGVVRVRGDLSLENLLSQCRAGDTGGWVETELLMDLPKAAWSGADIEAALREATPGKDSQPTASEKRPPQSKGGRPQGYCWPAIERIVRDWHRDLASPPRPVDLAKDIKSAAALIGEHPPDKTIEKWAYKWRREWWPDKNPP